MNNLDALVAQRARLTETIYEATEARKEIDRQITDLLSVGDSYSDGEYRATVTTRTTFSEARAQAALKGKRLDRGVRDAIFVQRIDGKALKTLLPEVWAESVTTSDPYVTMRQVSE